MGKAIGNLDDDDEDDKFFDAQEGSFDQISWNEASSPADSESDTLSIGIRATRTLSSDSVYEPPHPRCQGDARSDILPLSSDKRMSVSCVVTCQHLELCMFVVQ